MQRLQPHSASLLLHTPAATPAPLPLVAGLLLPPDVAAIHACSAAACGLFSRTRGRATLRAKQHAGAHARPSRVEGCVAALLSVGLRARARHTLHSPTLPGTHHPPHHSDRLVCAAGLAARDEQRSHDGRAAPMPVCAVDVHWPPGRHLLLRPVHALLDLQGVGRCTADHARRAGKAGTRRRRATTQRGEQSRACARNSVNASVVQARTKTHTPPPPPCVSHVGRQR